MSRQPGPRRSKRVKGLPLSPIVEQQSEHESEDADAEADDQSAKDGSDYEQDSTDQDDEDEQGQQEENDQQDGSDHEEGQDPDSTSEDDGEPLSALDSTSNDDADEEWGTVRSGSSTTTRAPVSFNESIVHVPYDGAMPEGELKERLNTPLDLGPVTLTTDQLALVRRSAEALERSFKVHTNRSAAGSGKTICTYAIAKLLGLKVVVVKPTRVSAWREEAARCGFTLLKELGYEGLRSVKGHSNPKHGLLTRHDPEPIRRTAKKGKKNRKKRSDPSQSDEPDTDHETEDGKKGKRKRSKEPKGKDNKQVWIQPPPQFTATSAFLDLLNEPILLVLDETHRGKTVSEQTSAISALVNALVNTPGHRSRCLLLSATQFDQREHSLTVCQTMGLIPHANQPVPRDALLVSLGQAFEPGHKLMQRRYIKAMNRTTRDRRKYVYRVYIHILSPRLTSAVPKWLIPPNMDGKCGFYRMPKDKEEEVRDAMNAYRVAKEAQGQHKLRLAQMSDAIRRTQLAKVSTVVRLVKSTFQEDPCAAVSVMGESLQALWDIAWELQDHYTWNADERHHNLFNPKRHVLSGELTPKQQIQVIDEFQSGECSLLIANLKVGGEGLNLQDKIGDKPRYVFMLPNNHATAMVQGLSRFYRQDTKSNVVVRLVYCRSKNRFGKDVQRERVILDNHKKKDRVWHDLMPEQSQQGAEFLAGFPVFYEPSEDELE